MSIELKEESSSDRTSPTKTRQFHEKVISLVSPKGGVGRTSITFLIAHYLNELGYRILIIDLDGQGNLSTNFFKQEAALRYVHTSPIDLFTTESSSEYIALHHPSGINVIFTECNNHFLTEVDSKGIDVIEAFYNNIKAIAKDFDFVVIDTPSSPGIRTTSACVTSDYIFLPAGVDEYVEDSLVGSIRSIESIGELLEIDIKVTGILVNNVTYRDYAALIDLQKLIGTELLIPTPMRRSVNIGRMKREARPAWHFEDRTARHNTLVALGEIALRIPEIEPIRIENFMKFSKRVIARKTASK